MTNLGDRWQVEIQQGQDRRLRERAKKEEHRQEEAVGVVIANIPGLVKQAIAAGHDSVRVYGWITFADVRGSHADKVDKLANRADALQASDLAGTALQILQWCESNGLECFMVREKIWMNDCEYDLWVRPKH
ncbi:MAG: hypothetical protein Q7S95_01435 [bacterium]|nr:hypothetical protein [bacterium]